MAEVIYGVAASLDGFIGPPEGGGGWLAPFMRSGEDYGFEAFVDSVGAILMGSRTYEESLGRGGGAPFGKPCYVFSSRRLPAAGPDVTVTAASPQEVVAELDRRGIARAWHFGGARLFESFRAAGLITGFWLGIVPAVLGAGLPLFASPGPAARLRLTQSKVHPSGVLQLWYEVDREGPARRAARAKRPARARKR
jgi:dihydrofolate reductase